MKFTISAISSVLLAPVAFARPRTTTKDEPLAAKSRITAFIVDDKGEPSVECWELNAISESMQVQSADGSKAVSHALSISRGPELDGVDILTWPSFADVWPPATEDLVHSENFDLSNTFNLFNIQGGLINFNFYAARFGVADDDDKEDETHIFSLENGDDWFYFEDDQSWALPSQTARDVPYPFHMSTISGTETEVLRMRYKSQPKHTVLHKGACSFTGIDTSAGHKSSQTTRGHSGFTVQVDVEDL